MEETEKVLETFSQAEILICIFGGVMCGLLLFSLFKILRDK